MNLVSVLYYNGINVPTIILEKAKGDELYEVINKKPDLREPLYKKEGELLNKIHQIKIQGFGELILEEGKLKGKSTSWRAHLESLNTLERYKYLIEHNLVTNEEYSFMLRNYEDLLNIKLNDASYVHNDFVAGHLFTDEKEITGVIDLGAAFAGDPKYDMARSYLNMSVDEQKYFAEGYGVRHDDEIIQKYLLYIAGRMIHWRHKHNYVDDPVVGYMHPLNVVKQIITKVNI